MSGRAVTIMMQTGRNSARGGAIAWLDRRLFGEMEAGDGKGNGLDTGVRRRKQGTYLVGGVEREGFRFKDTIVGLTITGCKSPLRVLRYAFWIAARTFSGAQVPRFQLSLGTNTRTVRGG